MTRVSFLMLCVVLSSCVDDRRSSEEEGKLWLEQVVALEEDDDENPYPEGPYGTEEGSIIANLTFNGYVDDDGDSFSANDTAREFSLNEFRTDEDAKIIMVTVSATWCGPCQSEATHARSSYEDYHPRGARMVSVILSGMSGTYNWANKYNMPMPVLADPTNVMTDYLQYVPLNMFVDPKTMKIVEKVVGTDYHDSMEFYLQDTDDGGGEG